MTTDAPGDLPAKPAIETALDIAFERARADAEETGAFYDALFSATLFLPIEGAFDEDGEETDDAVRTITPIVYEIEEKPTLLIFDTEERLARWADEPVSYVALRGDQIFGMFSGDEQLALNIGVAPSSVVIPQGIVEWLHERAADPAVAETVNAGSALDVLPPPDLAPEIVARLTARLAGMRAEVTEAVLICLAIDAAEDEDKRRIVLAVVPSAAGLADADAIAQGLAQTARGAFEDDRPVEIALLDGDSPLMQAAREVGFKLPILEIGSIH